MTKPEASCLAKGDGITERNELVMRELPRVYCIAARLRGRLPKHVDMEDLVQDGVIGLLDAHRKYDSQEAVQFNTFAKHRIHGAMLDSLRRLDWGSRILRRQGREIASSAAKLQSLLGRYATEEEIAADLNMRTDELQNTITQLNGLRLVGQVASVVGDQAKACDLIESAPSGGDDNPLELFLEGEMKVQLADAIARMSQREQLILSLHYYDDLTLKEISEVVGLSASTVHQIRMATMLKLRALLTRNREAMPVPVDRVKAASDRRGRRLKLPS